MSVEKALASPASVRFVKDGSLRPDDCKTCPYLPICRGGCKRDWTQQRKNYYCDSFKTFFAYAIPRLQEMARAAMRQQKLPLKIVSSAAALFISPGWKFLRGSQASSHGSNFYRHNPYSRSSASGVCLIHSPFQSFGQQNR